MSDENLARADGPRPEQGPKQRADALRGLSPEVLAQAREAGQKAVRAGARPGREVSPTELGTGTSPTPGSGAQDAPAERGKQLELPGAVVGHPAAGYTPGAEPKAAETKVQEPAAKAAEYRKPKALQPPSPEMQKVLANKPEQFKAVAQSVPEKGIKAHPGEAGQVKATPVQSPKDRGAEGPSR